MLRSIDRREVYCRQRIITGIIHHVLASDLPEFRRWRIGVTGDVPALYREWRRPGGFMVWKVGSLIAARTIEAHFILVKGMIGGITVEFDDDAIACVCLFPIR